MTASRDAWLGALGAKLRQLDRMRGYLEYSQGKAARWLPRNSLEGLGQDELELLAALKGRFAELQDHLAGAMKLLARIEEQDAEVFTYVLNFMEKIGVLPALSAWSEVRTLRNDAAHAYTDDPAEQAQFYNQIFEKCRFLFDTLSALRAFARQAYPEVIA